MCQADNSMYMHKNLLMPYLFMNLLHKSRGPAVLYSILNPPGWLASYNLLAPSEKKAACNLALISRLSWRNPMLLFSSQVFKMTVREGFSDTV